MKLKKQFYYNLKGKSQSRKTLHFSSCLVGGGVEGNPNPLSQMCKRAAASQKENSFGESEKAPVPERANIGSGQHLKDRGEKTKEERVTDTQENLFSESTC